VKRLVSYFTRNHVRNRNEKFQPQVLQLFRPWLHVKKSLARVVKLFSDQNFFTRLFYTWLNVK